jgi:hypothetical protein
MVERVNEQIDRLRHDVGDQYCGKKKDLWSLLVRRRYGYKRETERSDTLASPQGGGKAGG